MLRAKLPYVFIHAFTAAKRVHPQTNKESKTNQRMLSKAEAMSRKHPQHQVAPMEAGDEEADCGVWDRMVHWAERA
jgi:hypothetical protein